MVLKTLKEHGVLLNEKKMILRAEELEFLSHILTNNGIKPSPEKIKDIQKFRYPENFDELRSFLIRVNNISE